MGLREYLKGPRITMALVGLFVGTDASPRRIVNTAQKKIPNETAVTMGPMDRDSIPGRKQSGAIRRARKPTTIARASSKGG